MLSSGASEGTREGECQPTRHTLREMERSDDKGGKGNKDCWWWWDKHTTCT